MPIFVALSTHKLYKAQTIAHESAIKSPNGFNSSFNELKEIHKRSFPDMRFGQFMMNTLGWINSTKKCDPFFPEENEMLNLIKEYANSNSMWYQGWDLLNK